MAASSGKVEIKCLESTYILEVTPAELDGSNVRGEKGLKDAA